MEGFITPRKVAETSTHLHGFEGCHGESFAVSNRASLEFLAFAASVSSKSSIKIAYPERNGMENADGHSLKCQLQDGFMIFLNFRAI